jgi:CRISPR/Cas system CMR-associated protein Cmr5 small subunit
VVVQQATAPNGDADKEKNDKDRKIQGKIADFTAWLFIVGVIQAAALWATIIWIRRQAKYMGEHAVHLKGLADYAESSAQTTTDNLIEIRRQADLMAKQTEKMERSVAASEKSAEAALAQIQMVKDKERARLEIELDEFVFDPNIKPFFLQSVNWRVTLHGPTQATILNERMVASIGEPEEDLLFDFGLYEMPLPNIITPLEQIIRGSCMISPTSATVENVGALTLNSLRDEKVVLYCVGQIVFKDVFGDVWELPFKRKLAYGLFWGGKMDAEGWSGKWVREGDNEERKQVSTQHSAP